MFTKTIILKIWCPILILVTCLSCEKDFLERAPSDFIPAEDVFSNIESAEQFLNNAYYALPKLFKPGADGNWLLASATDEAEQIWDAAGDANDFNTGNWNPNGFPLQHFWFDYYNAIRRINNFIKHYEMIPEDPTTPGRRARLLGEAHGLRAYYYFELMRMWGGVPIIDQVLEPSDPVGTILVRAPINEVVAFIKRDVDQAASLLPARHPQSQYGRFTAMAAKALWSRTALYHASPLHNPANEQSLWSVAASAAKEAIDYTAANNYVLSEGSANDLRPYERIFLEQMNNEVLFHRSGESSWWDQVTQSNADGGWGGTGAVQEMVDAYEMANGLRIDDAESGYNAQNPYANRDPRFYQTILYHGASWKNRTINVTNPGGPDYKTDHPPVNYYLRKFMYEPLNLYNSSNTLYRPWVLFRLAEIYLNYAEALNEASGPTADVYDYINRIRRRSEMPELPAGLDKDQMRERIQHERQIELAFEEHRFWDVRRWKMGEIFNRPIHYVDVNSEGTFSYPEREPRVFEARHYLFPIPQGEIDKNPQLIQNPGW